MDFKEYERQHTEAQPLPEYLTQEHEDEANKRFKDEKTRLSVDDLKLAIKQQIETGAPPQYILYAALEAIGSLTDGRAWSDALKAQLDYVYKDLAQESMIVNNAAVSVARLEEMRATYCTNAIKRLKTNFNKLTDLRAETDNLIVQLQDLAPAEDTQPTQPTECKEARQIITALAEAGYDDPHGEMYGEYKTNAGVVWSVWYNPVRDRVDMHNNDIRCVSTIIRSYSPDMLPDLFAHRIEPSRRPEAISYLKPGED